MTEQHQLSKAFPTMSGPDFDALYNDIDKHGQRDPITFYEGKVIDGWHRWQICEALGKEPKTEQLPDGVDPVAFVLSRNLQRRHLTALQRAVAVAEVSEWKPAHREKNPATLQGSSSRVTKTNAEMAAQADVSERTIREAKTVIKTGHAEDVKTGKVTVRKPAKPKPQPPAPTPEPEPENEGPTPVEMIEQQERELEQKDKLITSLQSSDLAKEIVTITGKMNAVNGRNHQLNTTFAEVEKTAKYQAALLDKIKKTLGVVKNAEIIPAIQALQKP